MPTRSGSTGAVPENAEVKIPTIAQTIPAITKAAVVTFPRFIGQVFPFLSVR
jgi:hypothetical protein